MTRVTMIAGGQHRDELLVLYNREPARRVQPAAPAAVLTHAVLTGPVITLNP